MYDVVSTQTPLIKGEIRVEYETNERIAVTKYDNPRDTEGNVLGHIDFQGDVLVDAVLHGVDPKIAFCKAVENIVGKKKVRVTEDIIEALEMVAG